MLHLLHLAQGSSPHLPSGRICCCSWCPEPSSHAGPSPAPGAFLWLIRNSATVNGHRTNSQQNPSQTGMNPELGRCGFIEVGIKPPRSPSPACDLSPACPQPSATSKPSCFPHEGWRASRRPHLPVTLAMFPGHLLSQSSPGCFSGVWEPQAPHFEELALLLDGRGRYSRHSLQQGEGRLSAAGDVMRVQIILPRHRLDLNNVLRMDLSTQTCSSGRQGGAAPARRVRQRRLRYLQFTPVLSAHSSPTGCQNLPLLCSQPLLQQLWVSL